MIKIIFLSWAKKLIDINCGKKKLCMYILKAEANTFFIYLFSVPGLK